MQMFKFYNCRFSRASSFRLQNIIYLQTMNPADFAAFSMFGNHGDCDKHSSCKTR